MRATRTGIMLATLMMASASWGAQEESLESHEHGARTTIVLDVDNIQPSETKAERNTVLVFENHSVHAITLRFVEPANAVEKVHCHFIRRNEAEAAKAPWELFGLQAGHLAA